MSNEPLAAYLIADEWIRSTLEQGRDAITAAELHGLVEGGFVANRGRVDFDLRGF